MTPTNKLRWVIRKNKVTAAQVKELADEWELSISQAKFELENKSGPILQQWWYWPDSCGEWRDIPIEIEVIENDSTL